MKDGIDTIVASLGDFPLDPDSGAAWLWSADGTCLVWASQGARQALSSGKADQDGAMPPLVSPDRFRALAIDLAKSEPDQQPVRVQQIRLNSAGQPKDFTCLCRPVLLNDGAFAMLAVAIGAPARSLKDMQVDISEQTHPPRRDFRNRAEVVVLPAPEPSTELFEPAAHLRELLATTHPKVNAPEQDAGYRRVIDTRLQARVSTPDNAAPVVPAPVVPAAADAITWLQAEAPSRRSLRFVWQTDAEGRFVHLSRELADAVGPSQAMILGQTWAQAIARLGIREADDIRVALLTHETWTARAALWPVTGAALSVPVELAGTPVVHNGTFAGFRGYGIARIEKAVSQSQTLATALENDSSPDTETGYQHFGPAIEQTLTEHRLPYSTPVDEALKRLTNPLPLRPAPSIAGSEPASKPALTLTEREAFREIARALEKPETEQEQKPLELESPDTAAPEAQEQPKAGSLQAIRNDLAKRSKLRLGARTVDEPNLDDLRQNESRQNETGKPLAPLIPYDALQARRELRSRPENAQAPWATMMDRLPLGLLVTQDAKAVFANRHLLDLTGHADLTSLREGSGIDRLFTSRRGDRKDDPGVFAVTTNKGDTILVDAAIHATSWNDAPATLIILRRAIESTSGQQYKALELDLLSARAELRELQSVLDTATDGIIAIDGEGRILTLNRSAEALFGFDQNELTGESLTVLLEPESHLIAMDYLEGLRSNGVRSIMNDGRDVKGRERKGGVLPLFMTIGRVGESHPASRFCVVLRDITHWKKVEADLTEAKRQAEDSSANKTDFLTTISHEIRTPLNAIIGFSQVMMTESFGPIGNERYRQYAKDINASGEHVVSLVNDLLDLSKVASGRLELSFASVDINAILSSCVAMIQPQANAGKVIVRSQLAAHLPMVVADERSIRQIALNLLSNAAKFTEAGGQVIASTSFTDQGEVVIKVRDTGVGMAEDEVRRAMEPFQQIPGPRSAGGTGLGLPLTKALVEANRAAFNIKSEPHAGTLVEVIFPSTRVLAE